ncbi:hypothetical protein B0H14DRAFT_3744817 [Mycena olivaceomarginata]|nr:hypothetical protein B0H14DRAFT_3744817 [Mycena olivaceomarginata]
MTHLNGRMDNQAISAANPGNEQRSRVATENQIWGVGAHREERESARESPVYEERSLERVFFVGDWCLEGRREMKVTAPEIMNNHRASRILWTINVDRVTFPGIAPHLFRSRTPTHRRRKMIIDKDSSPPAGPSPEHGRTPSNESTAVGNDVDLRAVEAKLLAIEGKMDVAAAKMDMAAAKMGVAATPRPALLTLRLVSGWLMEKIWAFILSLIVSLFGRTRCLFGTLSHFFTSPSCISLLLPVLWPYSLGFLLNSVRISPYFIPLHESR